MYLKKGKMSGSDKINADDDVEKLDHLCIVGGNVKPLWKKIMVVS